jgi:hypothetical protein
LASREAYKCIYWLVEIQEEFLKAFPSSDFWERRSFLFGDSPFGFGIVDV